MRLRRFKTYKKKSKNLIVYLLIAIVLCTIMIVNYIGNRLTPVVEGIVERNVDKSIHNYLFHMFSLDSLTDEEMMNIVHIVQNSNEEVVSVDYRFDLAYKYLSNEMSKVFDEVRNLDVKMENYEYDKNHNIFFVPLGIIDKGNIFITDFGFKMPCKVVFFNDIRMYFKTKVSSYGVNNLLVELYLTVDVENTLISPSSFYEFGNTYEIIVASKVVVGKIPVYYGNTLEKSSAIVSS